MAISVVKDAIIAQFLESTRTGFAKQAETPMLDHTLRLADAFYPRSSSSEYIATHRLRFERTLNLIKDLSSEVGEGAILDLGTGGFYFPFFHEIFPRSELLAVGELAPELKQRFSIKEWRLDLEREALPIESKSVAAVTLLEVLEHFYVDPMFCLAEINRVLTDDGILVLTTPNIGSWRGALAALTGYSPYNYGSYARSADARRHVHEYVPRDVGELLAAAGFESKVWTENFYCDFEPPALMEFLSAFCFETRDRGDTILGIAKKRSTVIDRYPRNLYDSK